MDASARRGAGARRKMAPMAKPSPQMQALSRALQEYGGEAPLAAKLRVSVQVLSGWLRPTPSKHDFQRRFREAAHLHHGEAQHIALRVDLLHDLLVLGLAEETFALIKQHLQVIGLAVEPDLHFSLGHNCLPFFTVSVR